MEFLLTLDKDQKAESCVIAKQHIKNEQIWEQRSLIITSHVH